MATDIQKPRGQLKRTSPTAGGANPRMMPALGIVKDNVDPTRGGRIFVYIVDNSGLDPDNRDNWRPVKFLSPFFGSTRPDAPTDGHGSYKGNPSSYGMWMSPPDIGTSVVCLFIDGDMNYGFYVGCVPEPETMQMVPAIGATDNIVPNEGEANSYGGAPKLPVANINTNNKATADSTDYLKAPKPVHSYSAAIMFQQGILRDPIRGPISSSSQRETPSRVGWGVSTPGRPIYDGGFDDAAIAQNLTPEKASQLRVVSRRGGHTIVMDDGDIIGRDNLVRIRTSLGHQILMSDDGQTLMLLHSNGQSYIELGKEGTVDIYSTNSINLRTQGDLNLHADNNVNIHAAKDLNIHGENIHIDCEKDFKHNVGADHTVFNTGKYTHKVNGVYAVASGGEASLLSSDIAYINGSKVNLNSGQPGTKPAEVDPIDKVLHTDTLFDKEKGFLAAPAKLSSITSRAPAHAPWSNAGQGVDVKTDVTADGQLPPAPSDSVQQTNNAADSATTEAVSSGAIASAPQIPSAGGAINAKTTQALAATAAADAKSGAFSAATKAGTAIVQTATGVKVAAGASIPLTAQQMEKAGVIKPGSAALVTNLAATTGNAKQAFSSTMFTSGNLASWASNSTSQATALATNLQQAQTGLQNAGAIKGNETATQVAGLTYSAAQNGLTATLSTVKLYAGGSTTQSTTIGSSVTTSGTNALPGTLGIALPSAIADVATKTVTSSIGAASNALKDIGKGNAAAAIAAGAKGALAGITGALTSLQDKAAQAVAKAQSASAGAFTAIKNSMKKMKAGVPQNLTQLAKESAEKTVAAGAAAATNAVNQAANQVVSSATNLIAGTAAASSTVNDIASSAKNAASSIASGLSALPGGASAASAVNNLTTGTVPNLPGTADLKNAMNKTSSSLMNNLSNLGSAIGSAAGGALASAATGLLDKLKTNPLASVLVKGLPAGAAAQLQNAINSVTSPGSGVKAPAVATGTTDRSSISGATTGQLGDPKIPAPDFSAKPPATDDYNAYLDKEKEYNRLEAEYVALRDKYEKAVKVWMKDAQAFMDKAAKLKIAAGLDPAKESPADHPVHAQLAGEKAALLARKDELDSLKKERDAAAAKSLEYFQTVYRPVMKAQLKQTENQALALGAASILGRYLR